MRADPSPARGPFGCVWRGTELGCVWRGTEPGCVWRGAVPRFVWRAARLAIAGRCCRGVPARVRSARVAVWGSRGPSPAVVWRWALPPSQRWGRTASVAAAGPFARGNAPRRWAPGPRCGLLFLFRQFLAQAPELPLFGLHAARGGRRAVHAAPAALVGGDLGGGGRRPAMRRRRSRFLWLGPYSALAGHGYQRKADSWWVEGATPREQPTGGPGDLTRIWARAPCKWG